MRKLILLVALLALPGWAQQPLKQSTATTIEIGPFVSDTDFKTVNTGFAMTSVSIELTKQSDTIVSSTSNSWTATASGGGTHDCAFRGKLLRCELTATDTDTTGRLNLVATVSGSLVVFKSFVVMGDTSYQRNIIAASTIADYQNFDCSLVTNANSAAGKG